MTLGGGGLPGCATVSGPAQSPPFDAYLLLDQSSAMNQPASGSTTKWALVSTALGTYVTSPQASGMSLGIQYFPLLGSCVAADYASPDVEIGVLPTNASALTTSLAAHSPNAGSGEPISAALEGALDHAKSYAGSHPDHDVSVLFLMGADPNACDTNLATLVGLTSSAASTPPFVLTYVIGVGGTTNTLDLLATTGGTNKAHILSGNFGQALVDALTQIRAVASCSFLLPVPPSGEAFTPSKVNLSFMPSGGAPEVIPLAVNESACPSVGLAWYYDASSPTRMKLCPGACSQVTADPAGAVTVTYGCATVVLPS